MTILYILLFPYYVIISVLLTIFLFSLLTIIACCLLSLSILNVFLCMFPLFLLLVYLLRWSHWVCCMQYHWNKNETGHRGMLCTRAVYCLYAMVTEVKCTPWQGRFSLVLNHSGVGQRKSITKQSNPKLRMQIMQ